MRLKQPRLAPLEAQECTPEQAEVIERASFGGEPLNIFKTLARHPKLLKRWVVFASHVLNKSTLPARERELVILRIGWLCQSGYEWGQHVLIALDCGLTRDEIERIKIGADAGEWNALDKALLRATDELHADAFISDTSWAALSEHLDEQQMLDVIFAVGNYNLVSMVLNSAGVQLDPGIAGFETDEKAE